MKPMLKLGVVCVAGWFAVVAVGQTTVQTSGVSESDPVLERALTAWPDGRIDTVKRPGEWTYEEGVLLDGMIAEWRATGDGRLFQYVKAAVDRSVNKDGVIDFGGGKPFPVDQHSLDDIEMGRSVLTMYRVLQKENYYKAATFLEEQVHAQPKNSAGGYWHKGIYPNQMWLDGAYMAEPFMEGYGRTFAKQDDLDSAVRQLLLMDEHMRDRKTGLLRHGWDDSKKMGWADKQTGLSPEVWARAMGWYAMALVDVLDRMPETDPQRLALEDVARNVLQTVARYQDAQSGLWWQVMDKGGQKGNYLEASASCMFVYAMAKGVRLGVAPMSLEQNVTKGWEGIQQHFVKPDGTLSGTVKVAGLGGTPYRSGTYDYYIGEEVGDNDAKGVGAYLLALSEITQRKDAAELMRKARGKTVLVDGWFNSQMRKTPAGSAQLFHYKWDDDANSGYSVWGRMFRAYGMRTEVLDHAPTAADLKGVSIYVIVSPDIPALNPNTHYMDEASAAAIEAWVKQGGELVMMENDSEHADQTHLDILSDRFGIHYNAVTRNRELNNDYANTIVPIAAGTGGIFHDAHKALMKETCTITVSGAAKAVLTDKGDTMMAVAHAGHGLVYANVDPWVYNEYTDGRKAPLEEDNFAGGLELTRWLVTEAMGR
ncbi:glycoside hydrolase family 88 protein [Granulicella sp. 5B5]|uniref:glycoside hydrolase family 88 protein n=1 Tax=Granulicella sp. 5B5 TaxID=1617967 RepID=UPI0015F44754|nr:glycoside hydrolase family 88 protein [Granulicella sp. 5B5]QMV18030.1 glycoside hydrolase family 88 protein [Granulicella sp. 5B5]